MEDSLVLGETTPEVEESEAVSSSLSPSVPEFGPVWPLPPPSHHRSAALKPLLFPEPAKEDRSYLLRRSRDLPLPCVLCEQSFGDGVKEGCERVGEGGVWEGARDQLLRHLVEDHAIVIHQVAHIASLRRSVLSIAILHRPIL